MPIKLKITPRKAKTPQASLVRVRIALANTARPGFNDKYKPRRHLNTTGNLKPIANNT